jgi:hypothetical protein
MLPGLIASVYHRQAKPAKTHKGVTPVFEHVKKSPHPLIPADAGIQTLPELPAFRVGQRLLGWTAPYGIDVPE